VEDPIIIGIQNVLVLIDNKGAETLKTDVNVFLDYQKIYSHGKKPIKKTDI